jgi:hypothetical protein
MSSSNLVAMAAPVAIEEGGGRLLASIEQAIVGHPESATTDDVYQDKMPIRSHRTIKRGPPK